MCGILNDFQKISVRLAGSNLANQQSGITAYGQRMMSISVYYGKVMLWFMVYGLQSWQIKLNTKFIEDKEFLFNTKFQVLGPSESYLMTY